MYIIENLRYLCYYILFSIGLYILYPLLDLILNNIKKYRIITPKHKQKYFISNLVKGILLGIFTPYSYLIFYNYIFNNIWNLSEIKLLASLYASIDLVSMFHVTKMQTTTIVHHTMVQVFYIISLLCFNFDEDRISNPIVIYAIFSTFAYMVNTYLALRLVMDEKYLKFFATISSVIYQFCCTINWSYQCYYLYFSPINNIVKIIYSIVIISIVSDDIVLIKFLNKNSYLKTN
jgi:hypothetical protein